MFAKPLLEPKLSLAQYRQHFLAQDCLQSSKAVAIGMVFLSAFVVVDFMFWGWTPTFFWLVRIRLWLVALSLGVLWGFSRTNQSTQLDWLVGAWLTGLAATVLAINFSRPSDYSGYLVLDVVMIFCMYLVFPSRMRFRLVPAAGFSFGALWLLLGYKTDLESAAVFAAMGAYVMANLFAGVISAQFYGFRWHQYWANQRERATKEELEWLVMRDPLTGVYNRRKFIEESIAEFTRYKRYGHSFTVAVLDLDRFKQINDQYGHEIGDATLRYFSSTIGLRLRTSDVFGRLGGEEFAILFRETPLEEARQALGRIAGEINLTALDNTTQLISVTSSIGLTEVKPTDNDIESTLRRADQALYRAKAAGRNRLIAG